MDKQTLRLAGILYKLSKRHTKVMLRLKAFDLRYNLPTTKEAWDFTETILDCYHWHVGIGAKLLQKTGQRGLSYYYKLMMCGMLDGYFAYKEAMK